jgi:DNA-binding MarR family transcriptional regulator
MRRSRYASLVAPIDKPEKRVSLAALIRAARSTNALAVRAALSASGVDDIPRDGVFAIAAIAHSEVSAADLGRRLGVSKQAVSQLLDTLVVRKYVERDTHAADRRRIKLKLTKRGQHVATLARTAADRVEERLVDVVGRTYVEHTRSTLTALIELASELDRGYRAAPGG